MIDGRCKLHSSAPCRPAKVNGARQRHGLRPGQQTEAIAVVVASVSLYFSFFLDFFGNLIVLNGSS